MSVKVIQGIFAVRKVNTEYESVGYTITMSWLLIMI